MKWGSTFACLVLSIAIGACGRPAPSTEPAALSSQAAPSSQAASSAGAPRASASTSRDFALADVAPSATPIVAGPSPAGAASSERADRLRQLLRGQTTAAQLPLVETDHGVAFSPGLYDRLTTETKPGDAPAEELSATLDPPVVLSGKLDVSELERRGKVMQAAFRQCYRRARGVEPDLRGKASLVFDVDGDGAVSKITVESAPPRSGALRDCLEARGRSQLFPPPVGGTSAKFRLVVRFASHPHQPLHSEW